MEKKYPDIVLALAGTLQATTLVRDIAKTGIAQEQPFFTTINSLYAINAPNVLAVYGDNPNNLNLGLMKLIQLLNNNLPDRDADIHRYFFSLIYLERKLEHSPKIMALLARKMTYAVSQAQYFSPTHPQVLSSLSEIYLSTLGTLRSRIQVVGNPTYLSNLENVHRIRALLLAGVRSALLWRQLKGSQWGLLFKQRTLIEAAKGWLDGK